MGLYEISLQRKRRKPSLVFLKLLRKSGHTVDDLGIITDTMINERQQHFKHFKVASYITGRELYWKLKGYESVRSLLKCRQII